MFKQAKPTIKLEQEGVARVTKNGLFPISILIYFKGKKKRIRCGIEMNNNDWDKIKKGKRLSDKLQLDKNKLDAQLHRCNKIVSELKEDFTLLKFIELYNYNPQFDLNAGDILNTVEKYIQSSELAEKTCIAYRTAANSFYERFKGIKVVEIELSHINSYKDWLRKKIKKNEKKISDATVKNYLRHLKALINFYYKINKINSEKNPFNEVKIGSHRKVNKALNIEQLEQISNYKCRNYQLQHAKDMFLLSFILSGINFGDMARLRQSDLSDGVLKFVRRKTSRVANVQEILLHVNEMAINIIETYKNQDPNSNYLLNILKDHMTEKQRIYEIARLIKNTNKHLKQISLELNFNFHVTTIYSRHSYSTFFINQNGSYDQLALSLGHGSVKTTRAYYSTIENKENYKISQKLQTALGITSG